MSDTTTHATVDDEFSTVVITLLKGVIARDEQEVRWRTLLGMRSRVREYVAHLGLELYIAEDDGYAFLRQRNDDEEREIPRLIPRRPLSYHVSLVLALLRRRVAEHDAAVGDARIVISVEEMEALMQPYLPAGSDEARRSDRLAGYLQTIAKLGFIRFLRTDETHFEVRRLINAFVTADWLADFTARLEGGDGGEAPFGVDNAEANAIADTGASHE